jgi:pectin methylesterase-like acyl-CoA thioesterase
VQHGVDTLFGGLIMANLMRDVLLGPHFSIARHWEYGFLERRPYISKNTLETAAQFVRKCYFAPPSLKCILNYSAYMSFVM